MKCMARDVGGGSTWGAPSSRDVAREREEEGEGLVDVYTPTLTSHDDHMTRHHTSPITIPSLPLAKDIHKGFPCGVVCLRLEAL